MDDRRLTLRRAAVADRPEVSRLLHAVWPDQTPDSAHLHDALSDLQLTTQLLLLAGQPIGLVSCFITADEHAQPRWELDLLALDPAVHGRGLATQLVQCALAARPPSAQLTRALVADGLAARSALYARAGFVAQHPELRLFVRRPNIRHAAVPAAPRARIIPVTTLLYRGAWLECVRQPAQIPAAAVQQDTAAWPMLGVLLDRADQPLQQIAVNAGFAAAGVYRWWHLLTVPERSI